MTNDKAGQKSIELEEVYEVLTDIRSTLKESLKWVKFAGLKGVKSVLDEQLPNDTKKLIYHLSDGAKGTQEIAKTVGGLSHQTVSNYWKEWEKVGLGESISVIGGTRFKRSFDLGDVGIRSPEIPKTETRQAGPESVLIDEQSKTEIETDAN